MDFKEYFKGWEKVIDKEGLVKIINTINKVHPSLLCPSKSNIFKAFELCPYNKCISVWIGQDPYPQKGVAQGLAFSNSNHTPEDKLSPSLQVLKEAVIDFEIPHNYITFDNTLESWAKQGILLLNSALTCEVNKIGSHVMLWRPFIAKLLQSLSIKETGIVYILFGKQAQTFKPYISKYNDILEIEHPAYYARMNKQIPKDFFKNFNEIINGKYNYKIKWFNEYA